MRRALLLAAIAVLAVPALFAEHPVVAAQTEFPSPYVPSGETTYKQFCGACHGADGKGSGPAASTFRSPPPDLTTLAKRHGGKFPYDYVSGILRFGPGTTAHGSSDMPTWGPIFQMIDKSDNHAKDRIRNLSDYLASLQRK